MDHVTLDVESRKTDTGVTVLAPVGRLEYLADGQLVGAESLATVGQADL